MTRVYITITLLITAFSIKAQDIHFSLWDMSPLNLNPAMTGQFDGDYRFNGNHRNQWSSVTVPFTTYSISADARDIFGKKKYSGGLQINQDRAGDGQFNTFQVNASGAYQLNLQGDSLNNLSFGLQMGVSNRSLTYDPLQFDAQYNGFQYDGSLNNQENFARAGRTYLNSNIGVGYFRKLDDRKIIRGGIGAFNLFRPKQSFFNDDNIKQDIRLAIHADAEWKVADRWDVLPSMIFSSQGKYKELNFGANARYVITDFMGLYRAAWLGVFYRNKDATFITLGVNYDAWKVGLNYDINLSTLKRASKGRGSFEIAVQYIIKLSKPSRVMHRVCPDYI